MPVGWARREPVAARTACQVWWRRGAGSLWSARTDGVVL